MATNTGFLLMAGLGALMFLGRGGVTKAADEDSRLLTGQGGGGPMPPAFNLQSYVDSLFGETATVPVQPPVTFFYPKPVVVTSSGVPAVVHTAPEIITPTTKVQIGGDGGETIVASSLAIIRQEQLDKQKFAAEANADLRTAPKGAQYFYAATVEANRIEEERMKQFARDLIAKNRAAQARTREAQEAAMPIVSDIPPTINFDSNDDDWSMNPFSSPGQPINVPGDPEINVDFTPQYSETFVISGGMDSPSAFDIQVEMLGQSEDDPGPEYYAPSIYAAPAPVHELSAAYDIGF